MKQEASKMILGMLSIAALITVLSGSILPLAIVAAVGYVIRAVAKGLDG